MLALRTTILALAIVPFLGGAALAGPANDASAALSRDLATLAANAPRVGSARDVGSDIVLTDVAFSFQGTTRIGQITITGRSLAPGGLDGARVVLENVEGLGVGDAGFRARRMELTNVTGTLAATLMTFAAPEGPLRGPAGDAGRVRVERVDVPDMTAIRTQGGQRIETTFSTLSLRGVEGGRVTQLSIAGARGPAPGGRGENTIGRITAEGVYALAGARRGTGPEVALESATIENLRVVGHRGEPLAMARILIGRVTVQPGEGALHDLTEQLSALAATPLIGLDIRFFPILARFAERLSIERVQIEDLRSQGARGEGFGIQRFTISDIAGGKVGLIEMVGFSGPDQQGNRTRLGRMAFEGLDASTLLTFAKDLPASGAAPKLSWGSYPHLSRALLENVELSSRAGDEIAKLQRAELELGPRVGPVPTRLRMRVSRLDGKITDEAQRRHLRPIGIEDQLSFNGLLDIEYVEDARELQVRDLTLEVADVGKLTLTGIIGGIDRQALAELPESVAHLGLGATLGRLSLAYVEAGGVAALMEHTAEQAGIDEDVLRGSIVRQARATLSQAVPDQALVSRLMRALDAFLEDPKNIAITMTPRADLPLAILGMVAQASPFALIPMLDVAVTANQ